MHFNTVEEREHVAFIFLISGILIEVINIIMVLFIFKWIGLGLIATITGFICVIIGIIIKFKITDDETLENLEAQKENDILDEVVEDTVDEISKRNYRQSHRRRNIHEDADTQDSRGYRHKK